MTYEINILFTFLVALFASLFVLPNLSHIANRIGLVDRPNARKVHKTPRPLVGGLGIVIATTFSALLFVPLGGLRGFFAGLAILLLVGFFDDYMEVGHRKKFLAQIFATTLLMYLSKVQLANFGNLLGFGEIMVPSHLFFIWAVTVFCVVGVTNAVNMIDGLDGLAGGVTFLAFLSFAVFASLAGNHALMLLNLAFCGAILGFLKNNWSPSILFMGDAGSLCLGFALSFMAIALTQTDGAIVPPVSMLLVLAVPISDTIGVMTKRIIKRRSPFKPDKSHLHHTLLEAGFRDTHCVVILLSLSAFFCVIGLVAILFDIYEPLLFAVFLCYFFVNYFFSSILTKVQSIVRPISRKQRPNNCPAAVHSFIHGLGKWKVFRGAHRYNVHLAMSCRGYWTEQTYSGRILNISQTGMLAQIDGMGMVCKECLVSLSFTIATGRVEVEVPVEHLWMSEDENEQYHGFRFCELNQNQARDVKLLIEEIRSK